MARLDKRYTRIVARKWVSQNDPTGQYFRDAVEWWPSTVRQKFADWLWAQGVRLARHNKRFYLECLNDEDVVFFLLKHGE